MSAELLINPPKTNRLCRKSPYKKLKATFAGGPVIPPLMSR